MFQLISSLFVTQSKVPKCQKVTCKLSFCSRYFRTKPASIHMHTSVPMMQDHKHMIVECWNNCSLSSVTEKVPADRLLNRQLRVQAVFF